MKLYTRTGDQGYTDLAGGCRARKNSPRIICCGDIDELNTVLGLANTSCTDSRIAEYVIRIQKDLLRVAGQIANPDLLRVKLQTDISLRDMETMIDGIMEQLPSVTGFAIPGGCETTARLQHARAVCRRVERSMIDLEEKESIDPSIKCYVNRLADLLYALALWADKLADISTRGWEK